MNVDELAEKISMDRSTLYRKMANSGDNFSIKEALDISKALKLDYNEVMSIFFDSYVA